MGVLNFGGFMLFLSTPSARRVTNAVNDKDFFEYFYPRPPRGG